MLFIISLLSLLVISGGFIILHFALKHRTAELRVAGWVLVIGGVLNIAGSFYFRPPASFIQGAMFPMHDPAKYSGWHGPKKNCHMREKLEKLDKVALEAPPPPALEEDKPEKPAVKGVEK
jgi:hypothetical protein